MSESFGGVRRRKRKRFRFDGDNGLNSSGGGNIPSTPVTPVIPANALLNEDGTPVLTEDGQYILV